MLKSSIDEKHDYQTCTFQIYKWLHCFCHLLFSPAKVWHHNKGDLLLLLYLNALFISKMISWHAIFQVIVFVILGFGLFWSMTQKFFLSLHFDGLGRDTLVHKNVSHCLCHLLCYSVLKYATTKFFSTVAFWGMREDTFFHRNGCIVSVSFVFVCLKISPKEMCVFFMLLRFDWWERDTYAHMISHWWVCRICVL